MEPIQVAVDPEAINRYVAESVLKSALGKAIADGVEAVMKGSAYGRSPVETAVTAAIQEQIRLYARELVRGEYADRIRQAVADRLTPERIGEIADGFVRQLGMVTSEDLSR